MRRAPNYRLIAIDPATKAMGVALYYDEAWQVTRTLRASGRDRQARQQELLAQMQDFLIEYNFDESVGLPLFIACEEPNFPNRITNNAMHKMLGALEATLLPNYIDYIPPTTVKRLMGHGSLDKMNIALAAGENVESAEEEEMIADLIKEERFDETDAIAIGMSWIELNK